MTLTINVPLLSMTLAHIEAHPESWSQAWWRCGTTMCFAGWACALAGGRWLTGPSEPYSSQLRAEDEDDPRFVRMIGGVTVVQAADRAQRLLGLSHRQAQRLFCSDNSLDDLREIVAELAGSAS